MKSSLVSRLSSLLFTVGAASLLAPASLLSQVVLTSSTSPASPGLTTVQLTGHGFPTGSIAASNITVNLSPVTAGAGPSASATASTIGTIVGSTKRVGFVVPSSVVVSAPTRYNASLTDTVDNFTSNSVQFTVDPPSSVSTAPSSGTPGQNVSVTITGQYSHFLSGVTAVSAGSGITVSNISVAGPTSLTALFAVGSSAATGARTVTVSTSSEVISEPNGFTVGTGAAASITATGGTPQSATINTAFGSKLQATVTDSGGNPLSGVTVTFTAPATGASGTFAGGVNTAATNSSGVATSAVFTANSKAGSYIVAGSVSGVSTSASFSLTNNVGAAASITATGGTPQSATISTAFSSPLSATVTDSGGNPLSGVTVTFTAPTTGASGTFAGGVNTAATNSSGVATSAVFTANSKAGSYTVTGSVSGVSTSASFSLTNNTGAAASIATTGGTPQSATINTAFASKLQATVTDSGGNPVSGITVTFTAPTTGASGTFVGGVNTATTNPSGVATSATFTANGNAGGYTVSASVSGVSTHASFSLTNTSGTPSSITATGGTPQSATISTAFSSPLSATVTDSGGNPLSGVTVTFTAPTTGASGTFAGGVNTATTNPSGVATSAVFTANSKAGSYTVTGSVSGVSTSASFSLTNNTGAAASIAATGGTPQSATINTAFASKLQATVTDSGGNPVTGVTVTFTAPTTGASGTFAGGVNTATTNLSGVATSATFTANGSAGGYIVSASVSGVSTSASYSLTNNTGPAASITATGGTSQSASINSVFTSPLSATVKDSGGNPISGLTVTFTAPTSGASGTFAGGVNTATTNGSGVATSAVFTANGTAGGYTVTASVSGVATPASFSLTNTVGTPASITASGGTPQSATINTAFASPLSATVKDSGGNAVSGVTVTFTAPTIGQSGTFAGGLNTATTNASGIATSAVFTANGTVGSYTVSATVSGVSTSAGFSLTNTQASLTQLNPSSGTLGQTVSVAVTGQSTHFVNGTTTAYFGTGITVNSVTVTDSTHASVNITIAPTTGLGYRTVTLTTGSEAASITNGFLVNQGSAAIASVTPNSGAQGQSYNIAVVGSNTNFQQGTTTASFGANIGINSVTVTDLTHATVNITISGSATLGSQTVTLVTGGEVASLTNGFTIASGTAQITAVNPGSGHQGDTGDSINLTGQSTHWVQGTTTASFGQGINVTSLTVNSATSATAVISIDTTAPDGNRTVALTTGTEVASSAANAFQVLAGVPSATLNPNFGVQGANPTIAINGAFTNFSQGVTTVNFGNDISAGTVTVNGPTQASVPIQISTTAGLGTRNITITTGTQSVTASFTVTAGQPTITSITPNSGVPGSSSLSVTVQANFTSWVNHTTTASFGAGISVGGAAAGQPGPVTVNNAGNLTASITIDPAATTGPRNVVITTGAEQETSNGGFTVLTCSTTPPSWISTSANPAQNATNVPLNTTIQIEFDAPIDRTTVNTSDFVLYDTTAGRYIAATVSVDATGRILTLTPSQLLAVDRQYYTEWGNFSAPNQIKDTCGNLLNTQYYYFTTATTTETAGPSLTGNSPLNGDTSVPENPQIVLQFSQPINPVTQPAGVTVTTGGTAVPGTYTFSPDYTQIIYTPGSTLSASTVYTVTYTSALQDGAGNGLTNPGSFSFTTGASTDTVNGTVTSANPYSNESNVGTNVTPTVYFSKIVDPLTINTSNFYLADANTGRRIAAAVSVASNRLSATLTPTTELQPNTYYYFQIGSGNYYDLAGNYMYGGTWYFYTGNGPVTAAPTVVSISPPNGATGTPVNTQVIAVVSTQINPSTVSQSAIVVKAGSTTVAGTVSVASDNQTITFIPTSNLAVSTAYSVTVSGFQDADGNSVTPFTSTFTTGSSSSTQTGSFGVTSFTPANGATGVSNTSQVVITFARAINPATANNILVRDESNNYYEIPGTWVVTNGNVATFTPSNPYPANAVIQVWTQDQVQDYAGNTDNAWVVTTFTAGNVADTSPLTVTSVTPLNGATGVGRNATIALTFSKSVNQNSVRSANAIQLFNGDTSIGTGCCSFSADNKTVFFTPTTPASSTITIDATAVIQDLSGNSLTPFQSSYTTAADIPTTGPQVVTMRPGSGATDVAQNAVITLFTNGSPLNPSTVQGAMYVTQNGVLVSGTIQVTSNNQAIQFTPSGPFNYSALVQVFLQSSAQDVNGNAVTSFSGQFTVQGNPSTAAPQLISENPANGAQNVPLNIVPQFEFDQALAPSTVNSTSVRLYDNCSGQNVPGTVSLVGSNNNVIQFQPQSPLTSLCNGSANLYYFQMNNFGGGGTVTNTDGVAAPGESYYFYVGTSSNTTAPTVVSIAPPNGSTGAGVNAVIVVTFSATIDPISVTGSTIQVTGGSQTVMPVSISFDSTDTVVTITPQAPLPASTQMTVTVNGVTDAEGNLVSTTTSQFTTGAGPNTTAPTVVNYSPTYSETNVPTNTAVVIQFSAQMAPASVNASTFYLVDTVTGLHVPAALSISSDLKTATLVPNSALAIDRQYYFQWLTGAMDITGNPLVSGYVYFTTAASPSSTVPQVTAVNPPAGLTAVPTNSIVEVQFNEPIEPTSVGQITLTGGGQQLTLTPSFASGNQLLSLTPSATLLANTQFTLTVTGVQDFAGHSIASPFTSTFTTGPSPDTANGSVTSADPYSNETNVGTNVTPTVYFSKRVNALSINTGNFYIVDPDTNRVIPATVSVAPDLLSATVTPSQPLQPNTYYYFQIGSGGYYDITGNYMYGGTWYFYTGGGAVTTGASVASISPPNGASGAPVNTQVIIIMSSSVNPVTVGQSAVTVKNGSTPVAGTVSIASDNQTITFAPSSSLAISTTYTVTVGGFTDQDGNAVQSFSSSFATGSSSSAQTGSFGITSVTPANSTTIANNSTPVVITFSRAIDPATVNNILVRDQSNNYYAIAGTWVVTSGNVATFTPTSPYPANVLIQVWTQDQVKDLAGNTDNAYIVTTFTTANSADTTAPTVSSVTPANGATGVGLNPIIVLTFSKSLNPSTVNSTNLPLFAGDSAIGANVTISSDNRTVTLQPSTLPANTTITVAATPSVQDLSGNSLVNFQSQFTTGAAIPPQSQGPSVITQRPSSGATDVPQNTVITLFTRGSPLNSSTVQGALHVSQNGTAISGTTQLNANGAIEFTPGSPLAYGALMQVYLDQTAQDIYGNPLTSAYTGQFTVQGNPGSVAPQLIASNPADGAQNVPLNVVPQFEFDQALASASVNSNSVRLYDTCASQAVNGTVSLTGPNNNVIQFQPQSALTSLCNNNANLYYFQMNNFGGSSTVANTDGVAAAAQNYYFYAGTASDTTTPTVIAVGPPNGATGVGVNAVIVVQFSKTIDPISVNGSTIQITGGSQTVVPSSISFDTTDTYATITPQAPLPASTSMTITVNGVTDSEGNAVTAFTSTFTTAAGPDTQAPTVVAASPAYNDTIPTNTGAFTIQFSEPMDPLSVNTNTLYVVDSSNSGHHLAGTVSGSSDMETFTFTPTAALTPGDTIYLQSCGSYDLAGNGESGCPYWYYTVGSTPDTTPPTVTEVNPQAGLTSVPTNALIQVEFSKEIAATSLSGVQLLQGSTPVPITTALSRGNVVLTLTPSSVLDPSTTYTISVSGVKDVQGNTLAATFTSSFTTGSGVSRTPPSIVSIAPPNGQINVPDNTTVQVVFNTAMDPLTFDASQQYGGYLEVYGTSVVVPSTVSLSSDGKTVTFTPKSALTSGTQYAVVISYYVSDVAGNQYNTVTTSTFTAQ